MPSFSEGTCKEAREAHYPDAQFIPSPPKALDKDLTKTRKELHALWIYSPLCHGNCRYKSWKRRWRNTYLQYKKTSQTTISDVIHLYSFSPWGMSMVHHGLSWARNPISQSSSTCSSDATALPSNHLPLQHREKVIANLVITLPLFHRPQEKKKRLKINF